MEEINGRGLEQQQKSLVDAETALGSDAIPNEAQRAPLYQSWFVQDSLYGVNSSSPALPIIVPIHGTALQKRGLLHMTDLNLLLLLLFLTQQNTKRPRTTTEATELSTTARIGLDFSPMAMGKMVNGWDSAVNLAPEERKHVRDYYKIKGT